jgi:hypothetical protein
MTATLVVALGQIRVAQAMTEVRAAT